MGCTKKYFFFLNENPKASYPDEKQFKTFIYRVRKTQQHPCPATITAFKLTYSVVATNLFQLLRYFTSLIKLIFTHFYRTVLTHVEKSLYCYLLFHLCMASPLFNIRRYTGPFPEWLCWWMKLLVNFVPNCLFFSFCVNIILRVSIFQIKETNPKSSHPKHLLKNESLFKTLLRKFSFAPIINRQLSR